MKDESGWHCTGSRYLFESPWFRLRQDEVTLPDGDRITYTLVDHGGWVMVVPLLEDGRVVMEHIYRYTVRATTLECPSGGLDGQTPEAAARRELEEETGYLAETLEHLGRFTASNGISNEAFDVFLATGLSDDGNVQRENTEQIEVELIPLADLRERVLRGEIEDAPSSLSIMLAWEYVKGV